ncbi:MAG: SGNH/GDSL hydrolase family protein [bacterium]
MKRFETLFLNFFLILLSLLVFFIILEVSGRIYLEHFASEKKFLKYASLKQLEHRINRGDGNYYGKIFHRYLGYCLTPNYRKGKNKHNSLGFRGDEIVIPKPEGEYRIFCLGGSTTYTSGVEDYRMAYPELLEQELKEQGFANVNVINAGTGGWSSWESLINFEFRILDLDPDMIIVYHGINDIHARFVWPPEAYRGDNSGKSAASFSEVFMPSILEYSTVIRALLIRAGITNSHADLSRTLNKRAETYYGLDFLRQKNRKTYPDGLFKKISAAQMLQTNKPIYFKRNIENMVILAHGRGIKTVLATFATSRLFENEPRVASKEYINAYAEMNQVLETVALETHANLFDFAGSFPRDKQYYRDGRHVNQKGVKLKAKLFAQYLLENDLIPLNPEPTNFTSRH